MLAAPLEALAPPPNAFWNTPCSSLACCAVNLPLETSPAIRLSIFDLMSPGAALEDEALEPPVEPFAPLCSEESMSFKAEDSALWSVELTAPELTSDCSSAYNNCSGDW
ncbi:MAG TPA: hypothetical protein VGL45_13580 [Bradyrhizobium sp.]